MKEQTERSIKHALLYLNQAQKKSQNLYLLFTYNYETSFLLELFKLYCSLHV